MKYFIHGNILRIQIKNHFESITASSKSEATDCTSDNFILQSYTAKTFQLWPDE